MQIIYWISTETLTDNLRYCVTLTATRNVTSLAFCLIVMFNLTYILTADRRGRLQSIVPKCNILRLFLHFSSTQISNYPSLHCNTALQHCIMLQRVYLQIMLPF